MTTLPEDSEHAYSDAHKRAHQQLLVPLYCARSTSSPRLPLALNSKSDLAAFQSFSSDNQHFTQVWTDLRSCIASRQAMTTRYLTRDFQKIKKKHKPTQPDSTLCIFDHHFTLQQQFSLFLQTDPGHASKQGFHRMPEDVAAWHQRTPWNFHRAPWREDGQLPQGQLHQQRGLSDRQSH